jgi:uncharacterized protein (DUF697 family)
MHDMDRVRLETEGEGEAGEQEQEQQSLMLGPGSHGEMELATELLEVANEQELEQFLGDLMAGATRAAGRLVNSPTGQALGDVLKDAARQALPAVGQAIGDAVAPGAGGDFGRSLGTAASGLFEMELEGLSTEDKEFELARRYVQFARAATRAAARRPRAPVPPHDRARAAAVRAARAYAPGLVGVIDPSAADATPVNGVPRVNGASHAPASGRWVRRGRVITVYL